MMRVAADPVRHPPARLTSRIAGMYALLLVCNLAAWAWAWVEFRAYPLLMGSALLAYGFGLRHAVDADHIAAIDNVTRKLMQEGKRPVGVGFMFSLGHSTVVILACAAIAATAHALQRQFERFHDIGGIIGTAVSAGFLLVIAIINLAVLISVYRAYRRVRRGEASAEADVDALLAGGGFLARFLRPLFGLITRSWHMYPLGLLFGLGFDTATEVGLLGMSATQASNGLSVWSIMVFPALFTAGMSLIDTTDGILMLGAYGWAFVSPVRKLFYNMTITAVSVAVALAIGSVEALGLLADHLHLEGTFWDVVGDINDHFGLIGYAVIGIFAASWLLAAAYYRWQRIGELQAKT